jgi:uncharacterized protein YdeI (YjbR/CyaY-like superfamily)
VKEEQQLNNMSTIDKRIDVYIDKSADFAKPILGRLRQIIHEACPEVTETMKWSFPHFEYGGSILCSMAAFKHHCAFGFWLGSLMKDPEELLRTGEQKDSMGQFGQIKDVKDLPSKKILIQYINEAMALNEKGVKREKPKEGVKKELVVPDAFLKVLRKNKTVLETFESLSYSHKKEYLEWITEAKTEETRQRRMAKTVDLLKEGKSMNWKYG